MKKFVKPELFLVKMSASQIMSSSSIEFDGTTPGSADQARRGGNGNTKIDQDLLKDFSNL